MEKITKQDLQHKLEYISLLTGIPLTEEAAEKTEEKEWLRLDKNMTYGGYRLEKLRNHSSRGVFGGNGTEPRLKAPQMYLKLCSIIDGLEWALKNNQRLLDEQKKREEKKPTV